MVKGDQCSIDAGRNESRSCALTCLAAYTVYDWTFEPIDRRVFLIVKEKQSGSCDHYSKLGFMLLYKFLINISGIPCIHCLYLPCGLISFGFIATRISEPWHS